MTPPRILVASDNVGDAELVARLLNPEFGDVVRSTDPDAGAADFQSMAPEVLVLAFDRLAQAQQHYLGLYRLGGGAHATAHQTIVLCSKDEVQQAYELCRRRYFDDYVLFWPMNHDASRLPMAVHHGVARLHSQAAATTGAAALAAQAQRIGDLGGMLDEQFEGVAQRTAEVGARLGDAMRALQIAMPGEVSTAEGQGRPAIDRATVSLDAASQAIASARAWSAQARSGAANAMAYWPDHSTTEAPRAGWTGFHR